jgi:septum formation protein
LILASASPQRTAILAQLGIAHTVVPAGVEEREGGEAHATALHNARAKAQAVAAGEPPHARVLGVDTVVVLDGEVLGKPDDAAHAARMLARLQGRTHTVVSGLHLATKGEGTEATTVTFRPLDAAAVDRYVATNEWRGRAGGYAIQERGAALVRRIEGDYLNVVGLPVGLLLDLAPELLG